MWGYAHLNRVNMIASTVSGLSTKRWDRFLVTLKLDARLEFTEGDIGVTGGNQVQDLLNADPNAVDASRRFGNSMSSSMPRPEAEGPSNDDTFERMENVILKFTKRISFVLF